MTRPAENQQTVEGLAASIRVVLEDYWSNHEPTYSSKGGEALAALRDLVAQAESSTLLEYPYCQVLPNGKGAVVLLLKEQIEWLTRQLGDYPWGGPATAINSEMHMALSRIREREDELAARREAWDDG